MTMSLDFGTTEFRALQNHDRCLLGRRTAAVYTSIPNQDAERRLLNQMHIPYQVSEESLIVLGTPAIDLARSMRLATIPLLCDGLVPTNDPLGRQLISLVFESILPDLGLQKACGIISRSAVDFEQRTDLQLFAQLIRLKGYDPFPVTSTSAVAYAELGNDQFTGLVLDWGACGASVGAFRLGDSVVESHLVNGGNLIDDRIATIRNRFCWDRQGNRYLDTFSIEDWKKSPSVRVDEPRTDDERLLAEIYREQMLTILNRFKTALLGSNAARMYSNEIKLICSGGCTQVGGFLPLIAQLIRDVELPVRLSEIIICPMDAYRKNRGAIIQLELDRLNQSQIAVA